jgi:hypothetical protein
MIIQHHNQDHTHHPSDGSSNDSFDTFLTKHLQQTQTYLPDDDFSAQVMQQLPAPKKLSTWQERLIILVPLILISALVLSQFSVLAVLIKLWILLMSVSIASLLQVGLFTTITVVCGAFYWFARPT